MRETAECQGSAKRKKVCSEFDFEAELRNLIETAMNENSMNAKQIIDDMVEGIKHLVDGLTQKLDSSSMVRPPKTFNILLIGETGSGKSTLINYLTNYFLGGTLQNLKIAIPTRHHPATEGMKYTEKNPQDTTKSKTSDCTLYKFDQDRYQFVFIDTPGLSNTEGTEHDDANIVKIMSAAEEIEDLSAILLVINGTVARATVSVQNTLTRLRGLLPDVLLNNLAVVLTNCSADTANIDLESLESWIVSQENVFYMNNSALSKPKNTWINNEKKKKKVTSLGSIATKSFIEMLHKRNKIKEELHGTLLDINKLQTLEDNWTSTRRELFIPSIDQSTLHSLSQTFITRESVKKKISSIESDISTLQKALKAKKNNIINCCKELKKICFHFNFVEELKNLIDNMRTNARALTSMDARQVADDMIESVKHLADELTKNADSSSPESSDSE